MKRLLQLGCLVALFAGNAWGQISLVTGQTTSNMSTFTNTLTLTLPNNPGTGKFVSVCTGTDNQARPVTAVADSNSNSYTQVANSPDTTNGGIAVGLWYLKNAPANATKTIVLTDGGGNAHITGHVAEFAGADAISPLDQSAKHASATPSQTSMNDPSVTPGSDGELLIGCAGGAHSLSSTVTPWTGIGSVQNGVQFAEYIIQTTKAAQAVTFTQSGGPGPWNAVEASFLAASSGTLYTRAAFDGVSPFEVASRVYGSIRAAAERSASLELSSRSYGAVRSGSDQDTSAEYGVRLASYGRATSDNAPGSESATRIQALGRAAMELAVPSEVSTRQAVMARTSSDQVSGFELGTRIKGVSRTAFDGGTEFEVGGRSAGYTRSGFTGAPGFEFSTRATTITRFGNDTSLGSDVGARSLAAERHAFDASASDSAPSFEFSSRVLNYTRSVEDLGSDMDFGFGRNFWVQQRNRGTAPSPRTNGIAPAPNTNGTVPAPNTIGVPK